MEPPSLPRSILSLERQDWMKCVKVSSNLAWTYSWAPLKTPMVEKHSLCRACVLSAISLLSDPRKWRSFSRSSFSLGVYVGLQQRLLRGRNGSSDAHRRSQPTSHLWAYSSGLCPRAPDTGRADTVRACWSSHVLCPAAFYPGTFQNVFLKDSVNHVRTFLLSGQCDRRRG